MTQYPEAPQVKFSETIKLFFDRYTDFNGRSRRSEYWWAQLLLIGCSILPGLSLATVIPGLAIGVRRLHDIGKSGWWILLNLVPIVGWIIQLVWAVTDSDPLPNKWGDSPKYRV